MILFALMLVALVAFTGIAVDVGFGFVRSARRVRPSAVYQQNALHLVYEQIVNPNISHQVCFTAALEQLYRPIIIRN
jgi:hypothetical protein